MAKAQGGAVRKPQGGAFGGYNLGGAQTADQAPPTASNPNLGSPMGGMGRLPARPMSGPTDTPTVPAPQGRLGGMGAMPAMPATEATSPVASNLSTSATGPAPTPTLPGPATLTNPLGAPSSGGPNPSGGDAFLPGGAFGTPTTGSREDTRLAAGQLGATSQQQTQAWIQNLLALMQNAQQMQGPAGQGALNAFTQDVTTGGFNPDMLNTLRSNLASLIPTGGMDPTQLDAIRNQFDTAGGSLQRGANIAEGFTGTSGAMNPETLNAALKGYGTFAETGGYTPEQQQAFIRQSTSGLPATYDTLAKNLAISRSASGGQTPGGETAQLARQLGQQQATATTGAKTALDQMINANKLSGLAGETGLGENVAGQRLSATGLLGSMGSAQGSLAGARGGLESTLAGLRQGAAGLQTGLESDVAKGSLAGASGLSGLYDTSTGQITQLGQQVLQTLGLNFSNQQDALAALVKLADAQGRGFMGVLTDLSNVAKNFGEAASGFKGAFGGN